MIQGKGYYKGVGSNSILGFNSMSKNDPLRNLSRRIGDYQN